MPLQLTELSGAELRAEASCLTAAAAEEVVAERDVLAARVAELEERVRALMELLVECHECSCENFAEVMNRALADA